MTITETRTRSRTKQPVAVESEARVFTVWGPHGATGKSTLAINLAYEFTQIGKKVLLLDLDTYAPTLAQLLPIAKVTAGLAGAARLIRQGRFTLEELDRLSVQLSYRRTRLNVLQGLANPSRWAEVTPETVSQLINLAKFSFDIIIADVASSLEDQLTGSEHPTQRNGATRTALQNSNLTITCLSGTPLSVSRYLLQFNSLNELQKNRLLVMNRSDPEQKLVAAIKSLTRESVTQFIPNDEPSLALAEAQMLPIALARRKAPVRAAIVSLAHKLLEWQPSIS